MTTQTPGIGRHPRCSYYACVDGTIRTSSGRLIPCPVCSTFHDRDVVATQAAAKRAARRTSANEGETDGNTATRE